MSPSESTTNRSILIGGQTVLPRIRKRPRCLTSPEESLQNSASPPIKNHTLNPLSSSPPPPPTTTTTSGDNENSHFGLIDLFGRNRWVRPTEKELHGGTKRKAVGTPDFCTKKDGFFGFFTLRMEHRRGGALAKRVGEERILLFRSDRAGAIAKIIFSSRPVPCESEEESSPSPSPSQPPLSSSTTTTRRQPQPCERRAPILANATVHALFVKDAYRGFNLGGLLFALCTTCLRERYRERKYYDFKNGSTGDISSMIKCGLEAEEDIRRHDKLIHFYEHLGCTIRRRSKITFINNNDGETYRKVPMTMDLFTSPWQAEQESSYKGIHIDCAYSSFLPTLLISASGEKATVDNRTTGFWLILERKDGKIEIHTTDGRTLQLDDDGRCQLVPIQSTSSSSARSSRSFELLRISDKLDKVLHSREEEKCCIDDEIDAQHCFKNHRTSVVKKKGLWMVQSSLHGTFMGMTRDHGLIFSDTASFWQADENFCLTHNSDSLARRQHHRRMWMTQCINYVSKMRERYGAFDLHVMTIEEALNLTKHRPADPFSVQAAHKQKTDMETFLPSVRTLFFHTAELARKEGHPDWVQFVALIHGLACALTCLGETSSQNFDDEDENDDFDWTIYVDAHVMGCKACEQSTFVEFHHLNPDREDTHYNTTNGLYNEHVGLESVLLSWTSSEYMYNMLKHNRVMLPNEAYAILKLFPLVDWHTRGNHTSLSNEADEELKLFVVDFYELCQRSRKIILSKGFEMTDEECKDSWTSHYSLIANKYGAGDVLKW